MRVAWRGGEEKRTGKRVGDDPAVPGQLRPRQKSAGWLTNALRFPFFKHGRGDVSENSERKRAAGSGARFQLRQVPLALSRVSGRAALE